MSSGMMSGVRLRRDVGPGAGPALDRHRTTVAGRFARTSPATERRLSRALALLAVVLAAGGTGGCADAAPSRPAEPPNIVFLLVDDLGAMDIGAFNPDTFYETPNIDRLAAAGAALHQGLRREPGVQPDPLQHHDRPLSDPGGRHELLRRTPRGEVRSGPAQRPDAAGGGTRSPRRSGTAATTPRSWESGTWGRPRSSGRWPRAST